MRARGGKIGPAMNRSSPLAVLLISVAVASGVHAQEPAPPPPPNAATSRDTAVVVADAFDDETENAKLRAQIYDLCRRRGLSPDGKADTKAAAEQSGAMAEGRVVTDTGPLDAVRKAVGAALLIRIAKDAQGIRVLVVRDGDSKSKVVASAEAALAAVGELLGGKQQAPAAAPDAAVAPAGLRGSQGAEAGVERPRGTARELRRPRARDWARDPEDAVCESEPRDGSDGHRQGHDLRRRRGRRPRPVGDVPAGA
jgi:hypothetical protein